MTVPLVRCSALFMQDGEFDLRGLQLGGDDEWAALEHGPAFFDLTRLYFCVPADSIQPTGETATLTPATSSGQSQP